MEILKYRKDVNSPWQDIIAIKGDKGEQGLPGETGPQGEQGPAGVNGTNGSDGYTPVKGTDYWTETDKQEIIDEVLTALPAAEEVSV